VVLQRPDWSEAREKLDAALAATGRMAAPKKQ
jgi:hypothetical protein